MSGASYYTPRSRTFSPGPQPARSPASSYGSTYTPRAGSARAGSDRRTSRIHGSTKGPPPGYASSRIPQGTVKGPPPSKGPPQGSVKQPVTPAEPNHSVHLPGYDGSDRGPEDRFTMACKGSGDWFNWVRLNDFDIYDPLIKGTLLIEGVNYSKYEAVKDRPEKLRTLHEALKEDLISEVGNSVRSEDIKLKVYPGQIKTVVLHYDTRYDNTRAKDRAPPQLVDAEWCMKVDYVIRSRDVQRQQNIAMALYTTFTSEAGFAGMKARNVYIRDIDETADIREIKFSKPAQQPDAPAQTSSEPRLVSPTRRLQPPPLELPAPRSQQVMERPRVYEPTYEAQRPRQQEQHQHHHQQQQQQQPLRIQQGPISIYTPTEAPSARDEASPRTLPPMHQKLNLSMSGVSDMMSKEELDEKDRQLEVLQHEISRERKALRELQQKAPAPSQRRHHSVFTPNVLHAQDDAFNLKRVNPPRSTSSAYEPHQTVGKDLLSSGTFGKDPHSVPSVHEF